ncbi:hypothetical protein EJ08DRAFT_692006 [Tothia fuscella]|uniref:Kinetochore protein mis14 n=1 Tax=Tothia fuscella TaxID=1048955 RepID=A0A9P4P3X2_9PEZI|nr:hypothetical protein EJ08DRAFT_692006 [Tothia fuscella]
MATPDPQARLTTSEFRKIELQSPADMQHLLSVARRAARDKIDAAFPPSAAPKDGEDDGVRRRVEELVEGYILDTFRGVREGASVNGVDLTGELSVRGLDGVGEGVGEVEYESLDTKLKERIATLEKQKETLTEKVADLRRQVPQQAAEGFIERWKKEDEAFEADMQRRDEAVESTTGAFKVGDLKRLDEVQATWETGTTGLVELKTDLTETVAKMERARGVVEEFEKR